MNDTFSQDTEKVQGLSSLDVLVADINRSIHNHSAVYKCEVTVNSYPKTHIEYTIAWLAVMHDRHGIILMQARELKTPIQIQLPLRIWTIL